MEEYENTASSAVCFKETVNYQIIGGCMKKTIWKFPIEPVSGTPIVETFMPPGSVILTAAAQGGQICVWAEVELEQSDDAEEVIFEVYGTGDLMMEENAEKRRYLGTAFLYDGAVVFHVYHVLSFDPVDLTRNISRELDRHYKCRT